MLGSLIVEVILWSVVYLVVWVVLLPLAFIIVTPVFLIRAILHPMEIHRRLTQDYGLFFHWWIGHFPFQRERKVVIHPKPRFSGRFRKRSQRSAIPSQDSPRDEDSAP